MDGGRFLESTPGFPDYPRHHDQSINTLLKYFNGCVNFSEEETNLLLRGVQASPALEREMFLKVAMKSRQRVITTIPDALLKLLHTPTVYHLFHRQAQVIGPPFARSVCSRFRKSYQITANVSNEICFNLKSILGSQELKKQIFNTEISKTMRFH